MKFKKLFIGMFAFVLAFFGAMLSIFGPKVHAAEGNAQESFSVVALENFNENANRVYNFMGAKLDYTSSMGRFFLKPADDPASVTTLVLPAYVNGKTVAYANFDLSGYTNLDTLIMFDSGYFCKDVLKTMHITNLYLANHLEINSALSGLTADNVYYVGTFDNPNYLSGQTVANSLLGLNANHYYYYDWSSIYFDAYAADFQTNYNLTFEKKLASECRYTEESFYITPNYSATYTEAGVTYLRYTGTSGYPSYTQTSDFNSKMIAVDSRIKTLKVNDRIETSLISDMTFDVVIAKDQNCNSLSGINTNTLVVGSNNGYFDAQESIPNIYLTTDCNSYMKISTIRGNGSNIEHIYIPADETEKFSKISDTFSSKVVTYNELPSFDFKFTDTNGEHTYKTRSFLADIDYCMRNLDILAFYGEAVTENDYLEDKFALYDLAISPELQTYTVSFDTKNLVVIEPVKVRVLENLPNPTVAHYTFDGWYTDRAYTTPVVEGTVLESAITLYGKFTHDKYTLRFNTIGVMENPESVTTDYIDELPRLFTETQKVEGWYYDNQFTHKANVGDELTENTVVYAKWVDLSYIVTFDTNELAEVESISVLRLPQLPTPQANGYQFDGWYYDEEFTRVARANDTLINDTTLYAKWTEITHTVTFDARGKAEVASVECGVLRNLPEPTNASFTFGGWFYDQAYTNEAHNGDVINNDTTLYAKWDEITYLITFNTRDICEVAPVRMLTVRNLPQPSVNGYRFDGWYYDQAYTNEVHNGDVLTENVTLYAKWSVANGGYYIAEPIGIYSSSNIDAKRLLSQCEAGLVFIGEDDVTDQASFSYAYNASLDNTTNYTFTLIASIEGFTLTKALPVKIDNSLGNVGVMIGADGNIYCGFNYGDYNNFDEITRILTNFIKTKMNIANPNVRMPEVSRLLTDVYEGSFNGGAIYVLSSGVNLRYSSPTKAVDESDAKEGYTSCDKFVITKDFDIYEAVREIAPYILKKDGELVKDYKIEITVGKSSISLTYKVNDKDIKSHSISYQVIESQYSYIAGFSTDYTTSVLLINKTNEDFNINDIYKEALKKGYNYVNNLEADYELSLKKEGTETFVDNIMRGNGSYYESEMTVYVVDPVKANTKGQEMIVMKDASGEEVVYVAPTQTITEKVEGWMNALKEKMESNKAVKISMIAVGSIFGILLIYGAFLLIRKFSKWLKRR
ncbi:MAG: InlB B-repeat-containing protein [Gammaproteobacteria bacterium]|nr:InlB B-repeat-containing protein [Gammaproteobacteria bacterium]